MCNTGIARSPESRIDPCSNCQVFVRCGLFCGGILKARERGNFFCLRTKIVEGGSKFTWWTVAVSCLVATLSIREGGAASRIFRPLSGTPARHRTLVEAQICTLPLHKRDHVTSLVVYS